MSSEQTNFVPVGSPEELGEDPKVLSLLGKKVGVFRKADGTVYALELTCKHQGAGLSTRDISGDMVTCPRHGWTYSIETGECLSHPAELPLRFHEVEIVDGTVFVALRPTVTAKAEP